MPDLLSTILIGALAAAIEALVVRLVGQLLHNRANGQHRRLPSPAPA